MPTHLAYHSHYHHDPKHKNKKRFAEHNEYSQVYGFILLPVAIAFVVYALRTYVRRYVVVAMLCCPLGIPRSSH